MGIGYFTVQYGGYELPFIYQHMDVPKNLLFLIGIGIVSVSRFIGMKKNTVEPFIQNILQKLI
jgi:hypothetical protein